MKKTNRLKGFTLVELIVVMAIIGILAGILLPSLIGYVNKARRRTDASNGKQIYDDIQTILFVDDSVYEGHGGKMETANESFHRHNTTKGYKRVVHLKDGGTETCEFTIISKRNGATGKQHIAYLWEGNAETKAFIAALNKLEEIPDTSGNKFAIPIQCKKINHESLNRWYIILRTDLGADNTNNYNFEIWIGNDASVASSGMNANNNLNPVYRVYPNPSIEYLS